MQEVAASHSTAGSSFYNAADERSCQTNGLLKMQLWEPKKMTQAQIPPPPRPHGAHLRQVCGKCMLVVRRMCA